MRGPMITPEQVVEIRRLLSEGHSMRTVATMLDISRSSVKKYKTEEAVDRRRAVVARSNQNRVTRQRAQRRSGSPPGRLVIRTASPIVRALFEEMWRQGLKQADVAEKIGVSHNVLTLWKKGKTGPSLFSIEAMAQVLGFTLTLSRE